MSEGKMNMNKFMTKAVLAAAGCVATVLLSGCDNNAPTPAQPTKTVTQTQPPVTVTETVTVTAPPPPPGG
jgi:uncharacterized lipoprotein YajG